MVYDALTPAMLEIIHNNEQPPQIGESLCKNKLTNESLTLVSRSHRQDTGTGNLVLTTLPLQTQLVGEPFLNL